MRACMYVSMYVLRYARTQIAIYNVQYTRHLDLTSYLV